MYKKTLLFCLLILPFLLLGRSNSGALADSLVEKDSSNVQIEAKKLDKEAKILSEYLAKHDSPLQNNAQDFIDAAREYNLDWKLVVSIAGVESTFGKFTPGGYNGWGWGVYGNQAFYFNSWREGIFVVSKGLRENYIDKGLTEPYSINRAYATSPCWGGKVSFFMRDLEKFAQSYKSNGVGEEGVSTIKIAAVSGQLVISHSD